MIFQDDEVTNAGRGSYLTEDGHVECDASVMDGRSGAFGAVGAVPGTFRLYRLGGTSMKLVSINLTVRVCGFIV